MKIIASQPTVWIKGRLYTVNNSTYGYVGQSTIRRQEDVSLSTFQREEYVMQSTIGQEEEISQS